VTRPKIWDSLTKRLVQTNPQDLINIKLWEIAPETLLERNLPSLLPLLPLTEDGNRRKVVQQMFSRLQQADEKVLLAIGYRIALRVLEEIDQQWLKETFMNDKNRIDEAREIWEIFEGTWLQDALLEKYVKSIINQGKEEELVELLVKRKMEKEQSQLAKANLLSFVKARFPDEFVLANQQVGLIATLPQAQELIDKLYVARTDDEVKAILLSIPHA